MIDFDKRIGLVLLRIIFLIILSVAFSQALHAKNRLQNSVVICPALGLDAQLPDFASSACLTKSVRDINPTNTQIWVKAQLLVPEQRLDSTEPLGLFIFGKASSLVYLNGAFIGQNGSPGIDRQTEIPGKMDAVIFVPKQALKSGLNEVMLKMSGHGGFLNLVAPIQQIGLGNYAQPTDAKLRYYWKSTLPLGILFLGALYFGIAAFRQREHWLLPLMSLFAAGQLCAEVSRGLIPYTYPFHDIRLVLILLFSLSFGLAMLAYNLNALKFKRRAGLFLVGGILTLAAVFTAPGFDLKSALAVGLPTAMSLGLALYGTFAKRPRAIGLALSLSIFLATVTIAPTTFLDVYFFYLVATLLIFFFIQQLSVFEKESLARSEERERGDKLQLIIDQNQLDIDTLTLRINNGNKTELINVSSIAYCKGAGDYVEVALINGKTLLHSEKMTKLERNLPITFLRVHRSYIVNTTLITSLERKKSGVGLLSLENGETVPVSRRIMPSVRERLV